MTNFKEFIMNDVAYVLIVNKDFEIVYNSRYDTRMGVEKTSNLQQYKSIFEMHPQLTQENSSILKTMSTGETIYNDMQEIVDAEGREYVLRHLTVPIFREGKIVGVVELTKDITTLSHMNSKKERKKEVKSISGFEQGRRDKITFNDILTKDENMNNAIEQAKVYALHSAPTLIYGETGTGKELFAQAMMNYISNMKGRKKLVIQNCAAVPENSMESILFGTTKGSYTGAENKVGLFEEADGGVFFLDELNALPYHIQGKLLRVIQEGTFRPIGSNREKKVDVKVIAAMNIDPIVALEENVIRKDLFYRLSGGMVYIPSLRERKSDIEYLTENYIEYFNGVYDKNIIGISTELKELFMSYSWEGNVRELKHVIESMVSMSKGELLEADQLPLYLHNKIQEEHQDKSNVDGDVIEKFMDEEYDLKKALEFVERRMIEDTLKKVNGNKTHAGKILGIPRQTLKYKMDKLNIEDVEK